MLLASSFYALEICRLAPEMQTVHGRRLSPLRYVRIRPQRLGCASQRGALYKGAFGWGWALPHVFWVAKRGYMTGCVGRLAAAVRADALQRIWNADKQIRGVVAGVLGGVHLAYLVDPPVLQRVHYRRADNQLFGLLEPPPVSPATATFPCEPLEMWHR